jgi:hypothetical protein
MGGTCFGRPNKIVKFDCLPSDKSIKKDYKLLKSLHHQTNSQSIKCSLKEKGKENWHLNETGENEELFGFKLIKSTNNNLNDLMLIESVFNKLFFMRGLEHNSIVEIITNTPLYSVKRDIKIYEQGNIGNFFFIIQKGSIKLNTEDTKERVLKSGDYFGELALLQEDKRKFTASSLEETYLYCIERKEFRRIINKINKQNFEENKSLIDSIGVLSFISY